MEHGGARSMHGDRRWANERTMDTAALTRDLRYEHTRGASMPYPVNHGAKHRGEVAATPRGTAICPVGWI